MPLRSVRQEHWRMVPTIKNNPTQKHHSLNSPDSINSSLPAGQVQTTNKHIPDNPLPINHIHIMPLKTKTRQTQHWQAFPGKKFFPSRYSFLYRHVPFIFSPPHRILILFGSYKFHPLVKKFIEKVALFMCAKIKKKCAKSAQKNI